MKQLKDNNKPFWKDLELSKVHIKIVSEFGMISPEKMQFLDSLFIQRFQEQLSKSLERLKAKVYCDNCDCEKIRCTIECPCITANFVVKWQDVLDELGIEKE